MRAAVDVETVRYYERVGRLPAPKRQPNGYRAYRQNQLERLAFIRHCRALDMSLADIRLLLDFIADPSGDCSDVNRAVDAQLDRVRARLKSPPSPRKAAIRPTRPVQPVEKPARMRHPA